MSIRGRKTPPSEAARGSSGAMAHPTHVSWSTNATTHAHGWCRWPRRNMHPKCNIKKAKPQKTPSYSTATEPDHKATARLPHPRPLTATHLGQEPHIRVVVLHRRLVRVDLGEHVVLVNGVALGLAPTSNGADLHGRAELGHCNAPVLRENFRAHGACTRGGRPGEEAPAAAARGGARAGRPQAGAGRARYAAAPRAIDAATEQAGAAAEES